MEMHSIGAAELSSNVALDAFAPWASPARELPVPALLSLDLNHGGSSLPPSFTDTFALSPAYHFRSELEESCAEPVPLSPPFHWSGTSSSSSTSSSLSPVDGGVCCSDEGASAESRCPSSSPSPGLQGPPHCSHRHGDAARRSKELSSFRRLERLTGLASERWTKRGKPKKRSAASKLAVLEASADRLERLQALLEQRTAERETREQRVQQLTQRLQCTSSGDRGQPRDVVTLVASPKSPASPSDLLTPFPASASSAPLLRLLDDRHALLDAFFLHSPLAMLLLDMERPAEAGQLLDANESEGLSPRTAHTAARHILVTLTLRSSSALCTSVSAPSVCRVRTFCRATGWQRPSAVWIPAEQPGMALKRSPSGSAATGKQCAIRESPTERVLVPPDHPSSPAGQSYHGIRQWPSSVQLMQQLGQGQRQTVYCPWRCLWADGLLYEVQSMTWVCSTATVRDERGRDWEKPTRCITAFSMHEAVQVDPL